MLNVRYGIQTEEATEYSTIGWGLIPEAYANFGYLGVISIGLLFGAMCGLFERLSNGTKVISLPSLLTVAATMQFVDIELDLAELITESLAIARNDLFILRSLPSRSTTIGRRSPPAASSLTRF